MNCPIPRGLLVILLLAPWSLRAGWEDREIGFPLVWQRATADYGAKGAVWSFAATPNGKLILGADQLIVTDGENWKKLDLAGIHGFRGLASDSRGRVWVGADGELGYLETEVTGTFHFNSLLSQLVAAGVREIGEIRHVCVTPQGIVFAGDRQIYRWDGTRFAVWTLTAEADLQSLDPSSDQFWFYQRGTGVWRLDSAGPTLIYAEAGLPAGPVIWITDFAGKTSSASNRATDGPRLLGTLDAVYRLNGTAWVKLPDLSIAVAETRPVCAVRVDDDTIAIGTYLGGIILASPVDQVKMVLNRRSGLNDEHVHSLWIEKTGHLWAGLASGFANFTNSSEASIFDYRNGLPPGPILDVQRAGAATYVVTRLEVCRLESRTALDLPARFVRQPTAQSEPESTAVGSMPPLPVERLGSLWRRELDDRVHARFLPTDRFCLAASRTNPGWLYFTDGRRIKAFVDTPAGQVTYDLGQSAGEVAVSILEDDMGDLWVSGAGSGIVRFRLNVSPGQPPRLIQMAQYRPGQGLPSDAGRPKVAIVGGRIYAFSDSGILALFDPARGFEPDPVLRDFFGLVAARESLDGSAYWALSYRNLASFSSPIIARVRLDPTSAIQLELLDVTGLSSVGRVTSLNISGGDRKDALWIGGTHGLLRAETDNFLLQRPPGPVRLAQVRTGFDALLPLAADPAGAQLSADTKTIRFDFATTSFAALRDPAHYFQTRLVGIETQWSLPRSEANREFTGLAPGRYIFQARAIDRGGQVGTISAYPFVIASPWYARWPSLAVYAVCAFLLVLMVVRLRIRRLEAQAERLNQLVADRTHELSLANAAKSEFLANVSHEIRNPLNGLVGLVGMLNETNLSASARHLADSLAACARSLMHVFGEVLNFSKLEYGAVPIHATSFNLRGLLDDIVGVFAAPAQLRGNSIRIHLPANDKLRLHADREKIATVVSNFLSNAIKYSPGTPIDLTVECHSDDLYPESAQLTINVTDYGPGVAANEQELIFRKFVRGTSAKDRQEPGAGLGLATCKAIAYLLDGHVGIESIDGHETTFYFRLPVTRAPEESPAPATALLPPSVERRGRALIVDDQDYNRLVMCRIAERLGYTPVVALTADEASKIFRSDNFSVVFLDWELSGRNGSELAQEMRRLPNGDGPIIVALTAHDTEEIKRACFAAGMDGFVLKPFDEVMIARELDQATARHSSLRSPSLEINLRIFSYLSYDDMGKARQAAKEYVKVLDRELIALDRSMERVDATGIERAVHRIRSHASVVRCRALNEAARITQVEIEAASPAELASFIAEISRCAAELKTRIAVYLKEM